VDLVLIRRAHLDPDAARAQSVEYTVVCREYRCEAAGEGKAGDHRVNNRREMLGDCAQRAPRSMRLRAAS